MKKWIWIWLVSMTALLGGCGSKPEDRVAFLKRQQAAAEMMVEKVEAALPKLDAQYNAFKLILADPTIDTATAEKISAAMEIIEAQIAAGLERKASVKSYLDKIGDALAEYDATGTITHWDELQVYGRIAQLIAPALPPPWNGYLLLATSVITLIGGLVAGKAQQKLEDKETLIQAEETEHMFIDVVESVQEAIEIVKDRAEPEVVAEVKAALKEQAAATQAKVKEVKILHGIA